MIVKPNSLPFSIHSYTMERLNLLEDRLQMLINDLEIINSNNNEAEILIGSRVSILFDDGEIVEGRVWGKKSYDNLYEINRDGYSSYINIPRHQLKNLSIGFEGRLEKEIWLTKTEVAELKAIFIDSEIPIILLTKERNIVQIVKIESLYPCDKIEFVLSHNLNSGSIKIPNGKINKLGYYEILVSGNNIKSIIASSEKAFDLSHNHSDTEFDS